MLLGVLMCFWGTTLALATKYSEAPILRTKVATGELPVVEKRLPEEPLIIEPAEEVGEYGGTWRYYTPGPRCVYIPYIVYENIVNWDPNGVKVVPNIARDWKISKDGKVFTFHLRKGIKWSDGIPFTADDIVYWYKDVLLNKDLTPIFPGWLSPGGTAGKVEKVDDYTVKFVFSVPHALFLEQLASPWIAGIANTYQPKHYMKQFHPEYTPIERLQKMAKEAGFDYWYQLYKDKDHIWNPERPVLSAWRIVTEGTQSDLFERNPYYWKVDTAGNQLPYIDRIFVMKGIDTEVAKMKAVAGEVDCQFLLVGESMEDISFLKQYEKEGNYRVQLFSMKETNIVTIGFNLNHKDPVIRKVFNSREFRIAMSLAIDRQKMIRLLTFGMAKEPRQLAPLPESPYYYEPAAKNYTEYDPVKANQLLDEMGLTKRDKDGYRLRPDGEKLTITIEFTTLIPQHATIAELLIDYWGKIGIKVVSKGLDWGAVSTRWKAGEEDMYIIWAGNGMFPLLDTRTFFVAFNTYKAPLWITWYETKGQSGEEPPAEIRHQMALYDQALVTIDEKKRIEVVREMLKINAENLYEMGLFDRPPVCFVIHNRFHNTSKLGQAGGGLTGFTGAANPCQFFIKK